MLNALASPAICNNKGICSSTLIEYLGIKDITACIREMECAHRLRSVKVYESIESC